jgi:pimeloyl-ACP methyl ester carboxylesterase
MICDGGPFARLYECVWNLYEKQYRVESRLLRAAFTRASLFIWGPGFEREMAALLAQIPAGFPVLSIRGGRDPLVSPAAIDDFWALQSSLRVERLAFPQGGHLDALRLFPHEYSDCVENFLASTRASACDCAPGHTREQTQVR